MSVPWLPSRAVDAKAFAAIRRRTIFECCKWDPQVEDVSVLADTPLLLHRSAWRELTSLAEALDRETLAAEAELRQHADLHQLLALPGRLVASLAGCEEASNWPRVNRYDFHFTEAGWRISEVNSDVPGGFIESAGFTSLVAGAVPHFEPCGDPAAALIDALRSLIHDEGDPIGMIHATAYSDDRQVMVYLSRRFAQLGLRTILAAPDHLQWRARTAHVGRERLSAIVRFFPAEWLPNLPSRSQWQRLTCGSLTPILNPATALLTQSKRFPLAWHRLRTPMDTWRSLLPETRELTWRDRRRLDPQWVYKPALGRVGDGVGIAGATSDRSWRDIRRGTRWHPRHWIAQRRFDAVPIATPHGERYPSLGVFVIGGRACGVYGRMSPRPLIDHRAMDIAVLVERKTQAIDAPSVRTHLEERETVHA